MTASGGKVVGLDGRNHDPELDLQEEEVRRRAEFDELVRRLRAEGLDTEPMAVLCAPHGGEPRVFHTGGCCAGSRALLHMAAAMLQKDLVEFQQWIDEGGEDPGEDGARD